MTAPAQKTKKPKVAAAPAVAPVVHPNEVSSSPAILAGQFMIAPPRVDPKRAAGLPQIGSTVTTFRFLEFFPEHESGQNYVQSRLSGTPFTAPSGTLVTIIDILNDRILLKVSQPQVGYRFAMRNEYVVEGEKTPPERKRDADAEAAA